MREMKMSTLTLKSLGAAFVFWLSYLNSTFSPLIWVLLILIFVDLGLNINKEGQQFAKLGSMAISLGIPSFISNNLGQPEFGKYLVAMLCLVYLQHVVPQFVERVSTIKFSKDPLKNQATQELIKEEGLRLAQELMQKAKAVEDSTKFASVGAVPVQGEQAKQDTTGGA